MTLAAIQRTDIGEAALGRSPARYLQIGLVGLPGKHGGVGGDHVTRSRIALPV